MKPTYFRVFLCISLIVGAFWNITFLSGIMTPDSHVQWDQLSTGRYDDWHPYFHTLFFLGPIKFIFKHPYFVGLIQQLWCYLLFSWIFSFFINKGAKPALIISLFSLFILSYPIGVYNMVVWKDIPFSYSIITFLAWLGYMLIDNKSWNKRHYLIYFILLSCSSYFRHNGLPYLALIPLLLAFKPSKKYAPLKLIILSAISYILFSIAIPKSLSIIPKPSWYKNVNTYHISAGLYANKPLTKTTPKTDSLLLSVLPSEVIKKKYNPAIWHHLHLENPEFNNRIFNSQQFWNGLNSEFYSKNLINNLPHIIGFKFNQFMTVTLGYGFTFYPSSSPKRFRPNSDNKIANIFRPLHKKLFKDISKANNHINQKPIYKILIWNSLIPTIAIILYWLWAIIKKKYFIFLLTSVVGIQIPVLFLFGVSNDWRYSFVIYLSLLICIPFAIIEKEHNHAV